MEELKQVLSNILCGYGVTNTKDRDNAIDLIIDYFNIQLSKHKKIAPTYRTTRYKSSGDSIIELTCSFCSNCDAAIDSGNTHDNYKDNYCSVCGTEIDWSKEE
jgi:hypothetical protein